MKKPVVDYREFRFSRLNTPQFSHMKLAIFGWLFYFSFYFLTENLIPEELCHPIHCALDDMIPFCEYFAVFYVFWYLLVFGSLIWTLLYDVESFTRLSRFIFVTQLVAMTIYILYPSRQDLRPEVFLRDNALTRLMAFIYSFDTSTGVFPSLHVAYSIGIFSVAVKKKDLRAVWKWLIGILVVLICAATTFVKQHSALDVLSALPVSLLAEAVVYWGDYWKPRLLGKKE